jgi:hypothetical protein
MKTVYNHGINDVPYASKNRWYSIWQEMLRRCYDLKLIEKYPTYKGCNVDEKWLYLSNFKEWYEDQGDVDNLFLDKDFLYPGNKVYSESNCILIPNCLNGLITKSDAIRGEYPIGVIKRKNRYIARCKNRKKDINLGSYLTPEDAYAAYCDYKIEVLKSYIPEINDLKIKDQMKQKIITGIHNQIQLLVFRNYK